MCPDKTSAAVKRSAVGRNLVHKREALYDFWKLKLYLDSLWVCLFFFHTFAATNWSKKHVYEERFRQSEPAHAQVWLPWEATRKQKNVCSDWGSVSSGELSTLERLHRQFRNFGEKQRAPYYVWCLPSGADWRTWYSKTINECSGGFWMMWGSVAYI